MQHYGLTPTKVVIILKMMMLLLASKIHGVVGLILVLKIAGQIILTNLSHLPCNRIGLRHQMVRSLMVICLSPGIPIPTLIMVRHLIMRSNMFSHQVRLMKS